MAEAGGHFRKAGHNDGHRDCGEYDGKDAGASQKACEDGWQAEDAAADDAVHDQSGETPPPDRSNQPLIRPAFPDQFRHRAFVSQSSTRWQSKAARSRMRPNPEWRVIVKTTEVPPCCDGARRLGLVTLEQMIRALVYAVENPAHGTRVIGVSEIRNTQL